MRNFKPHSRDEFWFYGNCLYRDAKFTKYLLKHHHGNWWSLVLPDGTETPTGTREECMEVAIQLARGERPSSNRLFPDE